MRFSKKILLMLALMLLSAALLVSCAGPQGETGARGEQGIQGEKGLDGSDGIDGIDGKSAYELAVEAGYNGTLADWLLSLEGDKGDTGEKGDKGDTGATGAAGKDGQNGKNGADGLNGTDGLTPYIGSNGNWWIGDTDTKVLAAGKNGTDGSDGKDGQTPYIGENGNWWIGKTDTKVKAEAVDGEKGDKGDKGDTGAAGAAGVDGKSAFELYCEIYGYEGTEEQWMADLISGKLTTYTVTFDLNGGTAGAGFSESETVFGGGFATLTVPSKEGHTFIGWYTGEGVNDGIFTSTTPVKQDITLVARWQINEFTVKFLGNNGATLKYQKVNYGGAAEAPTAPTIDKLKFTGWDTDFSSVKSDLTVKPIYVSDIYTITYNTNGGTELAAEEYYVGDTPVKPDAPTKEGNYFVGWYLDAGYTSEYNFDTALTGNTTLYAYFSEMIPIRTVDDLKAIADDTSAKYYLVNDIDLEGATWTPIWYFSGVLDGDGHKICNFIISSTDYLAGFFTTNSGTIENVTFSDFSFSVNSTGQTFTAGAIVGSNSGTINNCHIKDAVLSYSYYEGKHGSYKSYAGGLVGDNNGEIYNCSIAADINGKVDIYMTTGEYRGYSLNASVYVGGITGINRGTINNSYSITATSFFVKSGCYDDYGDKSETYSKIIIGGGVGENSGKVSNCEVNNTVEVSASTTAGGGKSVPYAEAWIGGFAYQNSGTISGCSSEGRVSVATGFNRTSVGGFVEKNTKNINNCYTNVDIDIKSTGSADSEDAVGGFVANNTGTINSCYSTGDITTATKGQVGGFAGRNASGATVSKSFCAGNITLTSTPANLGYFVGLAESGSSLFKSYYSNAMKVTLNGADVIPGNTDGTSATVVALQGKALLVDTLSWSEEIWVFNDGGYPTLSFENE